MRQSRFVNATQSIHWRVRIRRRLKVGDELINFISVLEPANAVVELIEDVLPPHAPTGAEAAVIAKRAAADRDGSIDIRAGETGIQAHFLHTLTAEPPTRSEEHTSELQSQSNLVCRLLLEKK